LSTSLRETKQATNTSVIFVPSVSLLYASLLPMLSLSVQTS